MEVNKLSGFVILIVLVTMLIGIGIIISDKIGSTNFYTRLGSNDTETILVSSENNTAVSLDAGNITNLIKVVNESDQRTIDASCYTVDLANGSYKFFINQSGGLCEFSATTLKWDFVYDYKDFATITRNTMVSVSKEISNISTSWLGLIVTVAIASIVLFLVFNSFSGAGKGGRQ